jgi:hypothetical protein
VTGFLVILDFPLGERIEYVKKPTIQFGESTLLLNNFVQFQKRHDSDAQITQLFEARLRNRARRWG